MEAYVLQKVLHSPSFYNREFFKNKLLITQQVLSGILKKVMENWDRICYIIIK